MGGLVDASLRARLGTPAGSDGMVGGLRDDRAGDIRAARLTRRTSARVGAPPGRELDDGGGAGDRVTPAGANPGILPTG